MATQPSAMQGDFRLGLDRDRLAAIHQGGCRGLVRRFLKFLHTMGAIGFMGAMASQLVMLSVAPAPTALAGYAAVRGAMSAIATWIFLPGLALTLVAGLVAMALTTGYQNAGWAWLKLATGVLIFEGFVHVQGSMEEESRRSAAALAGQLDPATLGGSLGAERLTLWVVLAVALANVALGIWRPKLGRLPKSSPDDPRRSVPPSLSPPRSRGVTPTD